MASDTALAEYPPTELCAECGGKCCKAIPGIVHPGDLARPLEHTIAAMLRTGDYAIDWWEGDIRPGGRLGSVEYLRPAVKGKTGELRDPSWGGECVFLEDSGCRLPFVGRPRQCRALEPLPDDACTDHECTKLAMVLAWRPHQRALRRALRRVESEHAD